ncbi:ras association domain-containing protein 10-like [Ornithodoros turicata]|uniref:ras association domain-containing protein 10-like n=1 Tax=Ornithodoros turicata TaxID=34597 RepID=UPI00313968B6
MTAEIPVWVGGVQKWVTGITKRTTCEDIVRAVLASSRSSRHKSSESSSRDPRNYALVERWPRGERPLDNQSRILKHWKSCGEEQSKVRFTLRKVSSTSSSSSSSSPTATSLESKTSDPRTSSKSRYYRHHRRKHSWTSSSSSSSPSRFKAIHPKKLLPTGRHAGDANDREIRDLIKTVICQGEKLDRQTGLLSKKDDEIEYYETLIHAMRVEEMGVNYLLDTYLEGSEEGCRTTAEAPKRESVQQTVQHYEKVLDICRKIVIEEEKIRDLSTQLRESVSIAEGRDRTTAEISSTQSEIQRLAAVNESQRETIDRNCRTILDCERILQEKGHCVRNMEEEMRILEDENVLLERDLSLLSQQQQWTDVVGECSGGDCSARCASDSYECNDSNSDTGISSLHSSSDDGVYVLDTLV